MPQVRSNPAVVSLNHRIVILGGNDYDGGTDSYWQFDPVGRKIEDIKSPVLPQQGIWYAEKSMPEKLFAHSACVIDGKIYVLGGMNIVKGKAAFSNRLYCFDPSVKKWHKKADMPAKRARFGADVLSDRIYAAGGLNDENESLNEVEVYDPETDKWEKAPPLPTGRNRLNLHTVGGRLFAVGGCRGDRGEALNIVEKYDPETKLWTKESPMKTARKNFASVVKDNKLIVIAGWDSVEGKAVFHKSVEEFDPKTGKWQTLPPVPAGRDGARACVMDGKIYVIGGYNGKILDVIEINN